MKRFLVVLLVLSVAGGVFAQNGGDWGKIEGEAGLFTQLRFQQPDFMDSTMDGGNDGLWFGITWTKEFGPWALTLPLRAEEHYFGTGYNTDESARTLGDTYANLKYTDGPLTVTMPFWIEFSTTSHVTQDALVDFDENDPPTYVASANANEDMGRSVLFGLLPAGFGNAGINVEWDNDEFGFKFGLDNILSNPSIGAVGGYYHFMGGRSQLYVSYKGAYGTEWWRASDYVLNPFGHWNGGSPLKAGHNNVLYAGDPAREFKFHWENIEKNGIAYRFYLMPSLQIGLTFAMNGGDIVTSNNQPPFANYNNSGALNPNVIDNIAGKTDGSNTDDVDGTDFLIQNFLKHPVFGVKYDEGNLAVSAMIGLEPSSGTFGAENGTDNTDMDVYLTLGAKYLLGSSITINGDLSGKFSPEFDKQIFNFGAEVRYNGEIASNPFIAGLGIKVLDLLQSDLFFGTEFVVAYNMSLKGGGVDERYVLDGGNAGPFAGLYGHFFGFMADPAGFDFGLGVMAGYKDLALTDKINFSITGELGLDMTLNNSNNEICTYFMVTPVIDWSIYKTETGSGSLQFKYELGSDEIGGDAEPMLNHNRFTTLFKWTL